MQQLEKNTWQFCTLTQVPVQTAEMVTPLEPLLLKLIETLKKSKHKLPKLRARLQAQLT